MPRVVHFEIQAEDPERAIAFYSAAFGWTFSRWGGPFDYWLIKTGSPGEPGIDGGLMRRQGTIDGEAVIAFVCTIGVSSVDDYLQRCVEHGAEIVVPKQPVPGVGWHAHLRDPEGNIFAIMEDDPQAG